ncbi:MAG: hypothetical protein HN849_21570 [Victivallales bacterium]|nr:hypothetical protein [Victivallales bacterium]
MAQPDLKQIKERLAAIQAEIQAIGPVMRGSVTVMGTRHRQPYFSVSIKGKTRLIYLGEKRAEVARQYVANYRELAGLVDEMTLLQMELLKAESTRPD